MMDLNKMYVSSTYELDAAKYRSDIPDEEGNYYIGNCKISISEEDYLAMKAAGVRCEEKVRVVLAATNRADGTKVRQVLFAHIAYADEAHHTNW